MSSRFSHAPTYSLVYTAFPSLLLHPFHLSIYNTKFHTPSHVYFSDRASFMSEFNGFLYIMNVNILSHTQLASHFFFYFMRVWWDPTYLHLLVTCVFVVVSQKLWPRSWEFAQHSSLDVLTFWLTSKFFWFNLNHF